MSYRADNQSLTDPLYKLLESIDREEVRGLQDAVEAREDSGEWNEKHIDDLNSLLIDLSKLRSKVKKLSNDNW